MDHGWQTENYHSGGYRLVQTLAHADFWECDKCKCLVTVLWTESHKRKLSAHECSITE